MPTLFVRVIGCRNKMLHRKQDHIVTFLHCLHTLNKKCLSRVECGFIIVKATMNCTVCDVQNVNTGVCRDVKGLKIKRTFCIFILFLHSACKAKWKSGFGVCLIDRSSLNLSCLLSGESSSSTHLHGILTVPLLSEGGLRRPVEEELQGGGALSGDPRPLLHTHLWKVCVVELVLGQGRCRGAEAGLAGAA